MTYLDFIDTFTAKCGGHLVGRCRQATEEMARAFPELVQVGGWMNGCEHYWCTVGEGGPIVDPTGSQFGPGPRCYQPWQPGDEIRVGRCIECGEGIYRAVQRLDDICDARSMCSDECAQAFAAACGSPVRSC